MYFLPKNRRKDDLIVYYLEKLLNDPVANIRFATVELIDTLYKKHDCQLKFYDKLEDRFEKEKESDIKEALDSLLNIAL